MTKTPDETKKGMSAHVELHECLVCPYRSKKERNGLCIESLLADALALIRKLEAELEDMTARYKIADDCAKKKGEMNEKLYAELAAVKAEQDATMNFLRNGWCETCLYGDYDGPEPPCINCTADRDLWQWKGMQKEDLS